MKIPKASFLLTAAFLAFGALTAPHARAQVSVNFFYNTLDPYGEWVQDPDYGYCWHPTGVDENWAPYTDGYWAYTDSGWTWVSYEDYGGIVYHYGRWAHLPGEGWVWVPGNVWAPAWVSWRTNDDYVGWAPLPPEAHWSAGVGFSTWVDARFDIGPGFFSFVGVRDFGAPSLSEVIVNRTKNVTIINNTTNITNITVNNSNVYTGGPSYAKYAALSAKPIPTLKLVRQRDTSLVGQQGGKVLARQSGGQLTVLAPRITPSTGGSIRPPKVAKTLTDAKADHGWDAVKDPAEREKLHAQIKQEAGSSTTTPAKPVNPDDLKLVAAKTKTEPDTKSPTAAEKSATPAPKTKKPKTTDITSLENAPATEEPAATPKPGKVKKAKTPSDEDTGATAEETPVPKKIKKAITPSGDRDESSADETPIPKKSKKAKTPSDSNLQPFSSGDNSGEPKSTKSAADYEGSRPYEGRTSEAGQPALGAATPKGVKKPKGEKTPKEQDQGYPPGAISQ
jgi:hypothetical protein